MYRNALFNRKTDGQMWLSENYYVLYYYNLKLAQKLYAIMQSS